MCGRPRAPWVVRSMVELDDICKCRGQNLFNASCMANDISGNEVRVSSFFFGLVAGLKFSIFVSTNLNAEIPQLFKSVNGKVEHAGIDVHNISVPLQRPANNLFLWARLFLSSCSNDSRTRRLGTKHKNRRSVFTGGNFSRGMIRTSLTSSAS